MTRVAARPAPRVALGSVLDADTIGDAIRADLAAGDVGYRAAGEKFIAQKAALRHGEWLAWLTAEGFDGRHARRLMEYAKTDINVRYADFCNPKPRRKTVSFEAADDPADPDADADQHEAPLGVSGFAINQAIGELVRLSEALAHVSAADVVRNAARNFDNGGGLDIGVLEALQEIRDWIDEVMVGITPFIVGCAHKED